MKITQTRLEGCFVIEPKVFKDNRGYFFESFNAKKLARLVDINTHFVQSNQSKSYYGVLRGLHYQLNPHGQAKLIRVLHGDVLDVVVDIRKGSPSYGKSFSILLTSNNKKQLYVPRGFAHGFVVHSEWAEFYYDCDNYYAPEHESGISYKDQQLNIDWRIEKDKLIVSEKDKQLLSLEDTKPNFVY